MLEIEKLSQLPMNKMMIAEIINNKIFRTFDDQYLNLRSIHRRTNDLVVYELCNKP